MAPTTSARRTPYDEECDEPNGDYEPNPTCEEDYNHYEDCEDNVPLSLGWKWNRPRGNWWDSRNEDCEEDYDYEEECEDENGTPNPSSNSGHGWEYDPECEPTGPAAAFVMSAVPDESDLAEMAAEAVGAGQGIALGLLSAEQPASAEVLQASAPLHELVGAQADEPFSSAEEVLESAAVSAPFESALVGASMASAAIPEPYTSLLALMGLAALALQRLRRRP
jgi:hypothetical protein